MSDTDKDKPYWVAAVWWRPDHWCAQHCPPVRRGWPPLRNRLRCDLPPGGPVRRRPQPRLRRCVWVPVYHDPRDRRSRAFPTPPGWFVDHVWTSPQRAAARDTGRRAAAEYRGSGEVWVEPPDGRARHSAAWLWLLLL